MKPVPVMLQLDNLIAHQIQAEHQVAVKEHAPMEQLHVIFLHEKKNTIHLFNYTKLMKKIKCKKTEEKK